MLNDIVNKCKNTVHRTIKMKPIDVTDDSYADYNEDFSKKDPKFKVADHVRISKYKNLFAKGYTPNWSEEVFVIKKVKNTVGLMLLMILMMKKLQEHFMKKNCKKQIQKNLE